MHRRPVGGVAVERGLDALPHVGGVRFADGVEAVAHARLGGRVPHAGQALRRALAELGALDAARAPGEHAPHREPDGERGPESGGEQAGALAFGAARQLREELVPAG